MGGGDEKENLIELSIADHAEAHRRLYETYGKKEDWVAWKALDGSISKEEVIREMCSIAGKKSQPILRELKVCSFYNEEKRNAARLKSIEVSRQLKTGFYDSEIQRELGKRGGPKNKGFVWLTDNVINIKYSPKQQIDKSVEVFLEENPTFHRGRINTHPLAECPHCGKVGSLGAMKLNHFDNCGKKRSFKIDQVTCPHCGKVGAGGAMKRFHFDECKERKNEN
jgi:endogenous inhibitor of DNA gyrase (YacG/DUF329 family)